MSFNILSSNQDYDAIAAAVAATNPDTIGLQEVRPEKIPVLDATFPDYPYKGFLPVDRSHTVGVLSKWPITPSESYPDPPIARGFGTTIDVEDTPIAFLLSHLAPK